MFKVLLKEPSSVPTFQDLAIKEAQTSTSPIENFLRGLIPSAAGFAADVATNPADALLGVATGGAARALKTTKPGQVLLKQLLKKRSVPKVKTVENVKNPVQFGDNVRLNLFDVKRKAGEVFAKDLDNLINKNPGGKISTDFVDNIRFDIDDAGKQITNSDLGRIRQQVRLGERRSGNNVLSNLLDDTPFKSKPSEITLQESRQIQETIKKIPTIKRKLDKGKLANWESQDLPLLDILDDVRSRQLEAFPELSEVNKAYAQVIGDYNFVKSKFARGRLLRNIKNNFGNDPDTLDAINKLLDPKVVSQIGGYRKVINFLGLTKNTAVATGVGAAFEAGRRAISE